MTRDVQGIVELASAFYGSAILFAALDTGVFAAVEKVSDLQGLCAATGCDGRGLRLLLDGCVAVGLLEKRDGRYFNTVAGRMALVPGGAADLSRAIVYNRDVYPAWGRLAELARTGRPVERPELHLGDDPARTRAFAEAMFARAMGIGRGVVPMLGLKGEARVLDLAGGPGAYAILMCETYPGVTCTTVDLAAISEVAREHVAGRGLEGRIDCRAGDYHSDVYEAEAYDAVTVFGALHQESPADIVAILARAHRALRPSGRLYVLDMMTDATRTAPAFSALFAVNMALTTANGWTFSDEELKGWMREVGFRPGETRPVPPPMPHWLVTAEKA